MGEPPYIITTPIFRPQGFYEFHAQLAVDLAKKAFDTRMLHEKRAEFQEIGYEILADFGFSTIRRNMSLPYIFHKKERSGDKPSWLLDCCKIYGLGRSVNLRIRNLDIKWFLEGNPREVQYKPVSAKTPEEAEALIQLWKTWADRVVSVLG